MMFNHENKIRVTWGATDYRDLPFPVFQALLDAREKKIEIINTKSFGPLTTNFHHFIPLSEIIKKYLVSKDARYCGCGDILDGPHAYEGGGWLEVCTDC